MSKDKRKQINVRLEPEEIAMITWLQRHAPEDKVRLPSMTQIMAQAVREKYEREFVPVMGKRVARR